MTDCNLDGYFFRLYHGLIWFHGDFSRLNVTMEPFLESWNLILTQKLILSLSPDSSQNFLFGDIIIIYYVPIQKSPIKPQNLHFTFINIEDVKIGVGPLNLFNPLLVCEHLERLYSRLTIHECCCYPNYYVFLCWYYIPQSHFYLKNLSFEYNPHSTRFIDVYNFPMYHRSLILFQV